MRELEWKLDAIRSVGAPEKNSENIIECLNCKGINPRNRQAYQQLAPTAKFIKASDDEL